MRAPIRQRIISIGGPGSDHWLLWNPYNVGSGSGSNSNAAAGYSLDTGEGACAVKPLAAVASVVRRRFCALYAPLQAGTRFAGSRALLA